MNAASRPVHRRPTLVQSEDAQGKALAEDRSIGQLISETKNLTEDEIQKIVAYQQEHGLRFGEAAVSLGFATDADVVFALSQQFQYPYTPENRRDVSREVVAAAQPFSQQAEAFRAIRAQLMMRVYSPNEPKRALAVLSPESGDGKSFFVANLGVVLAQLGGRTLVVDANMRNPRQHSIFQVPNTSGLSGILSGRQEENVIFQAPDIPSLFVMPVGVTPPNPMELLERPAFRLLLGELLRKFDHVVVDTPAAFTGADAVVIASKCGAALTIARKDKSSVSSLQALLGTLSSSSTKLVGTVFNEF
jgi:chain length determinant protein tyrosine kinase EpsG